MHHFMSQRRKNIPVGVAFEVVRVERQLMRRGVEVERARQA
jgi:hypothetical protein